MTKVKMMAGIAAISGKLGKLYFRTDRKTGRVSLCRMPRKRAHPLTEPQRLQHARFAAIAKMVKQMMSDGASQSRKQLWKTATQAYDAANQ